jgi:hypothetical protein
MNKLIKLLQSQEEAERLDAVEQLSESMNDEIFESFLERLKIEYSMLIKDRLVLQMENAFAVGKVGGGSVFARVFSLYLAHNPYLRSSAIQILSAGNDAVARFLAANFFDSNADVRKLIIDTLGVIATDKAKDALRKALDDRDINVKITAIEHLGNLRDTVSITKFLQQLKNSTNAMLTVSILDAIDKTGSLSDWNSAIETIMQNADISTIQPIYLPSIFNLIGKAWNCDDIIALLQTDLFTENYDQYTVEIIDLLTNACNRFEAFIDQPVVVKTLTGLLCAENVDEKMPFIALNLISFSKKSILKNQLKHYYDNDDINIKEFSENIVNALQNSLN